MSLYSEYGPALEAVDVLRQLNRFDDALDRLSGVDDPRALPLRIRILRTAGRNDAALELLRGIAVDDVEIHANRIAVLDRLHLYKELDELLESREHREMADSDGPWAYRVLVAEARALGARGHLVEAAKGLDAASEKKYTATVNGWRISAYLRLGRVREARELAVRLADAPVSKGQWRFKATAGRALFRLGNTDLAMKTLDEAIAQQPCYPHAWRWLAATQRTIGDFVAARETLDKAGEVLVPVPGEAPALLGDHPVMLVERALLHLAQYDGSNGVELKAAADCADKAIQNCRDCGEAVWAKARILRATGGNSALGEMRRLARSSMPGSVNTSVELAHALADATQWSAAIDAYREVLRRSPLNREALLGWLTVVATHTPPTGSEVQVPATDEEARLEVAVAAVERGLAEDVVIVSVAAERLAQAGHYGHAARLFNTVLNGHANPTHDLSYTGAIRAWAWAREFDRAQGMLDQALTSADAAGGGRIPHIVGIANGMLLGDQGRFVEANESLSRLMDDLRSRPVEQRSREDEASVALWLSTSFRWRFQHQRAEQVVLEALHPPAGGKPSFTRAADLHDELGWNLLDRREFDAARNSFQRALDLDPRHPAALRGLVQVHRAVGDLAAAEAAAQRGLAINPLDTNMLCELAWLHGEAGHLWEARRLLDEVLERDCANTHALEWKIIYLIREGRLDDAQADADLARRLRPESPGILEAACAVHLRNGAAEAARQLALSAGRDNDYKFAITAAAVCEQAQPRAKDWREWERRLARHAVPEAARVRAIILRRRHQFEEAHRVLDQHLSGAEWPGLRGELAEILLDQDKPEQALAELRTMQAQVPWSRGVARRIATTLALNNDLRGALDLTASEITRARSRGESIPVELLVLRGELLLQANRFDEAVVVAEDATRHQTRYRVEARTFEADARGAAGDVDGALRIATDLRRQRPGSRQARLMLARCLESVGRSREAAELLADCDRDLPHHPPALVIASWIRRGIGDEAGALKLVERALTLSPDDSGLQAESGWILLDQGNVLRASEVFKRMLDDRQAHVRALGHTGLGWCHLRGGAKPEPHAALGAFEKATCLDGRLPEAHLGISLAHRMNANDAKSEADRRVHLAKCLAAAQRLVDIDLTAASCRVVGRAAYELRDIATARHFLDRSVELNRYRGDRAGIGLMLLRQGQVDPALDVLTEGLTFDTEDSDLLAALGATYLDRAIRHGDKGQDANLALHYLWDAHARQGDHLFAIHNLATALTWLDEPRKAETLLTNAIERASAARRDSNTDRDDVPMLRLHLAEILRQPVPRGRMSRNEREKRKKRAGQETERAERDARKQTIDEFRRIQLRDSDPDKKERSVDNRWQNGAGILLAIFALLVFVGLWTVWLTGIGANEAHLTSWLMLVMSCALLGTAFAGLTLPRIQRFRLGSVEISSVVEVSQFATRDLDLPEPLRPPLGFGRIDTIRTQWITPWTAGTRLPRLGPAVGPLINTYYAHRDAHLPWRRL